MYGKHFESMYEGSMYGAGIAVFAVWGYVISHTRNSTVELNPQKLADTLGGKKEEIEKAISFLNKPDPISRFKDHDGRRLLQDGQFQYRVPSWSYYHSIQNEEARREYNRKAQAKCRMLKKMSHPSPEEARYVKELEANGEEAAEMTLDHLQEAAS